MGVVEGAAEMEGAEEMVRGTLEWDEERAEVGVEVVVPGEKKRGGYKMQGWEGKGRADEPIPKKSSAGRMTAAGGAEAAAFFFPLLSE